MSDTLPVDKAMRRAAAEAESAWVNSDSYSQHNEWPQVIAAAIRALDEAGWVVVPKVATDEMKIAAGDIGDGFGLTASQVIAVWSPLLAAAPRLIGDKA